MNWEPCIGSIVASGRHSLSYPIEIGWSSRQGAILSFLVRPDPDWRYWDHLAEARHHIMYADLKQYGRTPLEIAALMNAQLAGQILYFDGGPYNRYWLQQLFEAAHEKPTFEVGDFDVLLASVGCLSAEQRESAEIKVLDIYSDRKHRATEDVRFLRALFGQAVYEPHEEKGKRVGGLRG